MATTAKASSRVSARYVISAAVLNAALGLLAQPAFAQGAQVLEEVVVTAERRTSDVQRTAASVSVRTGEDLQNQGRFTLGAILENVPGVTGEASTGLGGAGTDTIANGVTIRGVRSNGGASGQNLSGVPATAIFVDEVYDGIGGTYDIERVEVLRGPQGTLYGRSATAGVIAQHTRNPDLSDFGSEVTLEAGNYNLRHATGIVNVPLVSDKLALRVAANHYERDGYYNTAGDAFKTTDAKAKLLFQPSEDLSVLLGAAVQYNTSHSGSQVTNLRADESIYYTYMPLGTGKNHFHQVWAQVNWDLGGMNLTYVPAFRSWYMDAAGYVVGPGGGTLIQTQYTPDDDFITHELRLSSDTDGRLSWQTGLFYYYNDITTSNYIRWDQSGAAVALADAQRETKDLGVFGEGTFRFTEALRLTAGLRYDVTEVQTEETYTTNVNLFLGSGATAGLPEFNATGVVSGPTGYRKFNNTTYKLRLEWDVRPSSLLYASISTGFLPGDVQITTGSGNLPVPSIYSAETLEATEIGTKNRFFDNRVQLNGAAYWYDYGGYQTSVNADPSNPGSARIFTIPMEMQGWELEALWQITSADRVGLTAAHTETRYVNTPAAFRAANAMSGLTGIPENTANLTYDHMFDLPNGSTLNFHGELNYRSDYLSGSLSPERLAQGGLRYMQVESQVLANLNLTWASENAKYTVSAYVRNVADERIQDGTQLQSITPSFSATASFSDPRTFGVVVNAKF